MPSILCRTHKTNKWRSNPWPTMACLLCNWCREQASRNKRMHSIWKSLHWKHAFNEGNKRIQRDFYFSKKSSLKWTKPFEDAQNSPLFTKTLTKADTNRRKRLPNRNFGMCESALFIFWLFFLFGSLFFGKIDMGEWLFRFFKILIHVLRCFWRVLMFLEKFWL